MSDRWVPAGTQRVGKPRDPSVCAGSVFGRLTVTEALRNESTGRFGWNCQCKCGGSAIATVSDLKSGKVRSCGCLRREVVSAKNKTHGHTSIFRDETGRRSRVYEVWKSMIRRCHAPSDKSYERYGARGIQVCDRWREDFLNFLADMGEPPLGMSIDREDNDGDYEPGNCKWATVEEQNNNTRSNVILETPDGAMNIAQFAKRYSLKYSSTRDKVAKGETTIAGIPIKVVRLSCRNKAALTMEKTA